MTEQEFTPEPPETPAPYSEYGLAEEGWQAGWKAGYLARQAEEEPTEIRCQKCGEIVGYRSQHLKAGPAWECTTPLREAVRARMQPDPDVVREAVPCDFCGAGIGAPCTVWVESSLERPMPLYSVVHQTRTARWRETR